MRVSPLVTNKPRGITGHIDFLQVRNGAGHFLDYKPDARTNKRIAQLAIYALALYSVGAGPQPLSTSRLSMGIGALAHQLRELLSYDMLGSWYQERQYTYLPAKLPASFF